MKDPHIVLEVMNQASILSITGKDMYSIVALFFLKNPILGNTIEVVRIDRPTSITKQYHLKLPKRNMDNYSTQLFKVDYIVVDQRTQQSHAIVEYSGILTPEAKQLAEKFSATIRKDTICGGAFFPGYLPPLSERKIRILGTKDVDDLSSKVRNVRMIHGGKSALFSREHILYIIPIKDMVERKFGSAVPITKIDVSDILFLDRVHGSFVRVVTEEAIYRLNIRTGKLTLLKNQPILEKKTVASLHQYNNSTMCFTGETELVIDKVEL